ncbi:MAG: hypothetical protein HC933_04930, partial [Pleurocapsa sp. SU_196_0]|nr:hypothetical protein [Pleurocapsa sp. SU_196_0]
MLNLGIPHLASSGIYALFMSEGLAFEPALRDIRGADRQHRLQAHEEQTPKARFDPATAQGRSTTCVNAALHAGICALWDARARAFSGEVDTGSPWKMRPEGKHFQAKWMPVR